MNKAQLIFKLRKNAPHIAFATGFVGVIAGTVLSSRAGVKAQPIMDDLREKLERDMVKADGTRDAKDVIYVYGAAAKDLAQVYAPTVITTGASLALLTSAHTTMHKRNVALVGALAVANERYAAYRDAVKEAIGEDEESRLRVAVPEHDPKPMGPGLYTVWFDQMNVNWSPSDEYNRLFLQAQQAYLNSKLTRDGFLFLSDVLESLGIPKTKESIVVGWRLGEDSPGDGYVDLGVIDPTNWTQNDDGTSEWAKGTLVLNPNVDGVIWDKI